MVKQFKRYGNLNSQQLQTTQNIFTRRLFVVVKQNGQIDRQAGEAYANLLLWEQGQQKSKGKFFGYYPLFTTQYPLQATN